METVVFEKRLAVGVDDNEDCDLYAQIGQNQSGKFFVVLTDIYKGDVLGGVFLFDDLDAAHKKFQEFIGY